MRYLTLIPALCLLFSCTDTPNEVVLTRPANEVKIDSVNESNLDENVLTQKSIIVDGTDILITPGGAKHIELDLDTSGQIKTLIYKRYDSPNTQRNELLQDSSRKKEGKTTELSKASNNPK